MIDVTILTDKRYHNPTTLTPYIQNVLDEDNALLIALEERGANVYRTYWDNPNFDWSSTKYILFRTTWDYFDRFDEFSKWLEKVNKLTTLINPKSLIYWNIDKHYLLDLEKQGVRIPPTEFIEQGDHRSLTEVITTTKWDDFILKPTVSGAARHTYKINRNDILKFETRFSELVAKESMMVQEYQKQITTKGEVAFMVFGGKFSHAVLKKAKSGDFRVQDDFGGTVEVYHPTEEEIQFAEEIVSKLKPMPVYARVDVIWNNDDLICIGEVELIEPELWFRMDSFAAEKCAKAIIDYIN